MTKSGSNRNNKKVTIGDIKFDSVMEKDYYLHLLAMKSLGVVTSIKLQPAFVLQDGYVRQHDGKKILPITYKADFDVAYADGSRLIIDVKGFSDAQFKIKRKMFDKRYPDLKLILVTEAPQKWGGGWVDPDELVKIRRNAKKAQKKVK